MAAIVLINDNWERVKDLSDIVRIVEENIGYEFAREVERIFDDFKYIKEENLELEDDIRKLNNTQKELRELFIKVLNLAVKEQITDEQADELLDDFDAIIDGDN